MSKKVEIGQIFGRSEEVTIGDFIGFKSDVEQYGKLIDIKGPWLKLSVYDSITGDSYEITEHRTRCWVD